MKTFTINKARRILGKTAKGISDEQIQKDIDTAALLKDIFFDSFRKTQKKPSNPAPNVP